MASMNKDEGTMHKVKVVGKGGGNQKTILSGAQYKPILAV